MSTMNTLTGDRYPVAGKAVWRVGYGAMRLAGDGVFGPPRDRDTDAIRANPVVTGIAAGHGYTGPGRSRVAADHRRQRSADPRDQQSRAPREKLAAGSLSLQDDEIASLSGAFS
jgi:hypothetical protein